MSRARSETLTDDQESIPLHKVVSTQSTGARRPSQPPVVFGAEMEKKSSRFRRGMRRRKFEGGKVIEQEEGSKNSMGRLYEKIRDSSVFTRYFLYMVPVGLAIAVPIVVGATVAQKATIGGVRIVWFFVWIEIVWASLWVSKMFAHFLPHVFQFVVGSISSKIRKKATMLRALELPISFIGWALCSFLTFTPLMLHNPTTSALAETDKTAGVMKPWQSTLRQILAALLICTIIFFVKSLFIQIISVSYHNKQFGDKIKDNKRALYLLSLMYDASRVSFPEYCHQFAHEDHVINDSLNLGKFSRTGTTDQGIVTPLKLIRNVGRVGDTVTSAFGKVAQEITGGAKIFDGNSSQAIVAEALEKPKACEALAKRIWMSFVIDGNEELKLDDIIDVLGESRQDIAEECFTSIDRDANGDISLDEMVLYVSELGRSMKSIATSKHDVDQAIKVLDGMLTAVVFFASVLVFVALLNKSFTTTLATTGTAVLSLSFVFAATCQEVLGSCIFLFVKHPYDVGDRVDITNEQLTVEHISLLFTVFKRVVNGKMVQIPNIVLNNLWVENITRSKAMRESIMLFCNFDTSFEDIEALRQEMISFVTNKDNSRDFQSDVDVDVTGLGELNKMELRIECRHKSNWANESIRAARRSKFMCALVLATRKVPIYAPGGGGAALGSIDQPSFSVSVSPEDAAKYRQTFADGKEAKRLIPTKKSDAEAHSTTGSSFSGETANHEVRAMQAFNARNPAVDSSRDDAWAQRSPTNNLSSSEATLNDERQSLDEVRGILNRESSRGQRRPGQMSPIPEPPLPQAFPRMPQSSAQYAPPPPPPPSRTDNMGAPQLPPVSGNAFVFGTPRNAQSSLQQSPRSQGTVSPPSATRSPPPSRGR